MQNVVGEKRIAILLEIDTKLSGTYPIECFPSPVEAAYLLTWVVEMVLGQGADDLDQHHL
jgi:hypothetical protein